jgi:hypothetical protein
MAVLSKDWSAAHPKGAYPAGVRRIGLKDEWLEADKQYAALLAPAPEPVVMRFRSSRPLRRCEFAAWNADLDANVEGRAAAEMALLPLDENATANNPIEELIELGCL